MHKQCRQQLSDSRRPRLKSQLEAWRSSASVELVVLDVRDRGGVTQVVFDKDDESLMGRLFQHRFADGDLEKVQRAFAAGAKDYLLTPYDPAVLEQKLERLLEQALHA